MVIVIDEASLMGVSEAGLHLSSLFEDKDLVYKIAHKRPEKPSIISCLAV
jgi:hypothetical protein